jgi:hypothetical protein
MVKTYTCINTILIKIQHWYTHTQNLCIELKSKVEPSRNLNVKYKQNKILSHWTHKLLFVPSAKAEDLEFLSSCRKMLSFDSETRNHQLWRNQKFVTIITNSIIKEITGAPTKKEKKRYYVIKCEFKYISMYFLWNSYISKSLFTYYKEIAYKYFI